MRLFELMKKNRAATALVLAFLLLLGNVIATPASAEDGDEKRSSSEIREQLDQMEAQYAENEAEIARLESQLQENLTEMEAIVAQKNVIDQEIFLLHKQVNQINEMISAYNVLIADKQEELNRAQERLDTLNAQNKERIRAMEEDGTLSYWSVLFKANSFSDLLDRLNMIEEIAAADQRRLAEMKEAADKVAVAQEELAAEKVNMERTQEELAQTETVLQEKRVEADELLAALIATGEEYERWLEESEDAQQELLENMHNKQVEYEDALASESYSRWLEESYSIWIQESIEASIQESIEESRRQEEATRPTYTPPGNNTSPSKPSTSGWRSPLTKPSWVTSPYGMRLHPIQGVWKMHHGVDLAANQGDTIVATRSGYVAEAGWDSWGGGNYVSINHGDGYTSIYMHMTYYVVSKGDWVNAGDVIGYVGSTGGSTGPHLHFSIYYNGSSVNPADYVSFS